MIENLIEGSEYFIGVAVVDNDDNVSLYTETSVTPMVVPTTPSDFVVNSQLDNLELAWNANTEVDLEGYKIYRTLEYEGDYELLNQELLTEPVFIDQNVESGQFYYYKIAAVDVEGISSEFSEIDRGRIVSLDHGILIIDDTRDGSGSFMYPTQAQTNEFNDYIFQDYSYDVIDTDDIEEVRLDDLGAYSTVFWLIYDNTNLSSASEYRNDIATYLDFGGKLLISSYNPSTIFGSATEYPFEFTEGDFAYDYLCISSSDYESSARFKYAVSTMSSMIGMETDPEKTLAPLGHHLINIESITPTENGYSCYIYGSDYEESSPFGSMNDMPLGIMRTDDVLKVSVFPYPFYYMEKDQVKEVMNHLLNGYYNEETSTDEEYIPSISNKLSIENFPNPFNPETTFFFNLKEEGDVLLEIYNIKGQKVHTIVNEKLNSGNHEIIWNGTDKTGTALGSGIYLYQLKTKNNSQTRKMMLLK